MADVNPNLLVCYHQEENHQSSYKQDTIFDHQAAVHTHPNSKDPHNSTHYTDSCLHMIAPISFSLSYH